MKNLIDEFTNLLDEKPSIAINADTVFKEIPEWDSLLALTLIVMVSNNYKKSINGEDVRRCQTIRDLYELING